MQRTRRICAQVAAGAALLALAGCGSPAGKAGGDVQPLTLTIALPDPQGRPSSALVSAIAEHARQDSADRLRVLPQWADPNTPVSDQEVAERVMTGDVQLGIVPARAWDVEGVGTFKPLQIPGLVASTGAAAAVAGDPITSELMSGLSAVDVVGLALVPEGVRRIFVFAPATPQTFVWDGSVIRATRSDMTSDVFSTLGAHTVEADGGDFAVAVRNGSITAAESSFALAADTLPYPAQAIADMPLFAKFQTIVANRDWFDSLTDSDRDAVRRAASETLTDALAEPLDERQGATAYCAAGGTVDRAAPSAITQLAEAGRSLTTLLSADPGRAHVIDQLRRIATNAPADDPIPTCRAPKPPSTSTTPDDSTSATPSGPFPEGVYRMSVTAEELQSGMSAQDAYNHAGLWTLTFSNGKQLSMGDGCTGFYTVSRGRVALHLGSDPACGSAANSVLFTARWKLDGTALRFLDVRSGQDNTPDLFLQTLFGDRPFTKIR